MFNLRHVSTISLLAGALALPVSAQTASATEANTEVPIEKRLEQDMISMPDMVQALARNLGQLHYIRTICFGQSDQTWRDQATAMMNIEAPTDREKRRLLIKAFNDGFYDVKTRHTQCSEGVSAEAAALAENGRHLASMLGDPYREN